MFCPRCKAEYRSGFTWCSDCDIRLVDYLPPERVHAEEAGNAGYVVVTTVQGPLEEGQICSFLEANGIPALVRGEAFRKVYGINIDGMGAAQILVPRELAETALDLLTKADRGELGISAADDESPTRNELEES